MNKEILDKNHEKWSFFLEELDKALDEHECDAKTLRLSEAILKSYEGIDVEGTLEYMRDNGGYCDCEIFMNVCDEEDE